MTGKPVPAAHFHALYGSNPDPWNYKESPYEIEKYNTTLTMLPRPRFHTTVELGCSIGVLTALLASRTNRLLAIDVDERALAQARLNCGSLPHVSFARMCIPDEWPSGIFDLCVLSEVIYYFSEDGLQSLADYCARCIPRGGVIVLVNWLGETGGPLSGEVAAEFFGALTKSSFTHTRQHRSSAYRIDVLTRSQRRRERSGVHCGPL